MDAIPIILDCDPGHDDALVIVLALTRPGVRLLAIPTVAGNAPLEWITRNALRVLTLLGRTDVASERLPMAIDTSDGERRGRTMATRGRSDPGAGAEGGRSIDRPRLIDIVSDAVASFP